MNHRISIGIVLSFFVVLLLSCGITASAAEAPASGSSGAALPAQTINSKKTDAAEQIIISADRAKASTSTGSAPVLISASLDRAGDPVPDGTVVDFAVSSGTGTLSGTTTTVNGIATVRLTSTTIGTVIVSATAGAASATISTSFLAQPKQAIVKVGTVGTLASGSTIGSLLASVTYPDKGYGIASGGVSPSGVAARATTTLSANFETRGEVVLALLDAGGIKTGEFATLTFQVADGFLPSSGDFSIAPAVSSVTAVAGNAAIPGIEVVVQSLTLR